MRNKKGFPLKYTEKHYMIKKKIAYALLLDVYKRKKNSKTQRQTYGSNINFNRMTHIACISFTT